ncbi:MAG: hypothetical protein AAFY65_01375 [Pseudomonadota bacterium]
MANMHDCLQRAMDAGELSQDMGRAAQDQLADLTAKYETVHTPEAAAVLAARDLKESIRRGRRSRQHAVLNQLATMRRLETEIDNVEDAKLVAALKNLVEHSEGSTFQGESVQSLSHAYIKSVNHALADVLKATGRDLLGNSRQKALMTDIMRELHGQTTGNPTAARMAEAVRGEQDRLRNLFNARGGDIGEIEGYGIKHSHDGAKLRRAAGRGITDMAQHKAAWVDNISDKLDWHRMIDKRTDKPFAKRAGQGPDTPARAQEFLGEVFDNISTGGMYNHKPSFQTGGKALYNQRAEARELHFVDGDAWLAYNAEFGQGDPFTSMVGGLHSMARDVAQMRVLGPNPRAGLEYAAQYAQVRAARSGNPKLQDQVKRAGTRAQQMLSHFDGTANTPHHEFWAQFFSGARQTIVAMRLGSALLSSVTDLVTLRAAAKHSGLNPNSVQARALKLMASGAERETAAQLGYVADTLANVGALSARFTGETFAPELTQRLSDFTMRASGLAFWTDMNRTAFQAEFWAMLAREAKHGFDDLSAPTKRLFETRGITADDWDKLRDERFLFTTDSGEKFLAPHAWRKATDLSLEEADGLSMRLQMVIEEQMEFAVPTSNLEMQSFLTGDTQPGTWIGELARSGTMFKSFALSLTINQIRRVQAMDNNWTRAQYAAKMFAGLTVMGAVAVQLKELAKGNDPRPMDDGKFLMAAIMQGGGLGIFGDFFAAETNRFGGGLASTLAGPQIGLISDTFGIPVRAVMALAQGKDTSIGRDLSNFFRYNTPVASSLWYSRAAFNRVVADQLQLLMDDDARRNWHRQAQNRRRTYGVDTWWDAGDLTPDRAPDFNNALGEMAQ